jgi:hypothetical protein
MIRRRSDIGLNPQKLFSEMLRTPLDWPGKTIRLEKNSAHEYRHRSLSPSISAAELYHENSKLFPDMLRTLTASELDPYEFRREFIRRRSAAVRNAGTSVLKLDTGSRTLLSQIAKVSLAELFYAIELRVVSGDLMAIHEPLSNTLQVVKQLSAGDLESMRRAIRLTAPPNIPPHTGAYLFIAGNFARNEILLGQRGYRHTLLEAGQLTQAVINGAAMLGLTTWPIYEFIDRDLDMALELDGIEESTLMAFELKGTVK